MRNVLILIILLGVAYYFYNRDNPNAFKFSFGSAAPVLESPAGSGAHNFDTVSAQLQADMNNIPTSIDGDNPRPVHAYNVKRTVTPHLDKHQEYRVLAQVCDVIIQADAERSSLQQSSRSEQSRTTYHSPLEQVSPQKKAALPDSATQQGAIRARVENTWNEHRARAVGEVERLLGTLQGRRSKRTQDARCKMQGVEGLRQ